MRRTLALGLLVVLAAGSVAMAFEPIDQLYSQTPNSLTVGDWTWDRSSLVLNVPETLSAPGGIEGSLAVTALGDSHQAWVYKEVTNATTFDWTDYHIDVIMEDSFAIGGAAGPASWTTVITQPVLQPDYSWLGTIDYYMGSGAAVPVGGAGLFGVQLSFSGMALQFTMNQTPTPEPATMTLLTLGGLAGGWLGRRRI